MWPLTLHSLRILEHNTPEAKIRIKRFKELLHTTDLRPLQSVSIIKIHDWGRLAGLESFAGQRQHMAEIMRKFEKVSTDFIHHRVHMVIDKNTLDTWHSTRLGLDTSSAAWPRQLRMQFLPLDTILTWREPRHDPFFSSFSIALANFPFRSQAGMYGLLTGSFCPSSSPGFNRPRVMLPLDRFGVSLTEDRRRYPARESMALSPTGTESMAQSTAGRRGTKDN